MGRRGRDEEGAGDQKVFVVSVLIINLIIIIIIINIIIITTIIIIIIIIIREGVVTGFHMDDGRVGVMVLEGDRRLLHDLQSFAAGAMRPSTLPLFCF